MDSELSHFLNDIRKCKNIENPEELFNKDDGNGYSVLAKLREAFDLVDEWELKNACEEFNKTVMLFRCRSTFAEKLKSKELDKDQRKKYKEVLIEWAIPAAICPEWYSEALLARLNNAMLVSALLLTVTIVNVGLPPDFLIENDNSKNSESYRSFLYLNGIVSYFFMVSIIFGTFFIENVMSRTYGKTERLILMEKFYGYKNCCQYSMGCGSALFPFALQSTLWRHSNNLDAWVLYGCAVAYVLLCGSFIYLSTKSANDWMAFRNKVISELCDDDGLLKDVYMPINPSISNEECKAIYKKTVKGELTGTHKNRAVMDSHTLRYFM